MAFFAQLEVNIMPRPNNFAIFKDSSVESDLVTIATIINRDALALHAQNILFPPNVLGDDVVETGKTIRRCLHLLHEHRANITMNTLDAWLGRYESIKGTNPALEYFRLSELALAQAETITEWLQGKGKYVVPASRRNSPNLRPALMFAIFYAAEYVKKA
jgi:hypothetical protein